MIMKKLMLLFVGCIFLTSLICASCAATSKHVQEDELKADTLILTMFHAVNKMLEENIGWTPESGAPIGISEITVESSYEDGSERITYRTDTAVYEMRIEIKITKYSAAQYDKRDVDREQFRKFVEEYMNQNKDTIK